MKKIKVKGLREPDLSISGFKMWIFARQFPESMEKYSVIVKSYENFSYIMAADLKNFMVKPQ